MGSGLCSSVLDTKYGTLMKVFDDSGSGSLKVVFESYLAGTLSWRFSCSDGTTGGILTLFLHDSSFEFVLGI